MNSSLKWKKSQCNGDQVVPDIDFEQKLDKRKFNKTLEDRLNTRHTAQQTVTTNVTNDSNSVDNRSNGHNMSDHYHRTHQNSGLHSNNKSHNSISTLDEFWEERYSRILTHNIFTNNSINFAETK